MKLNPYNFSHQYIYNQLGNRYPSPDKTLIRRHNIIDYKSFGLIQCYLIDYIWYYKNEDKAINVRKWFVEHPEIDGWIDVDYNDDKRSEINNKGISILVWKLTPDLKREALKAINKLI